MRTSTQRTIDPAEALADALYEGRIGPRGALERIAELHGIATDTDTLKELLAHPTGPAAILARDDYDQVISSTGAKFLAATQITTPPQWPMWCCEASLGRMTGSAAYLTPTPSLSAIVEGSESPAEKSDDGGATVTLSKYGGSTKLTFEAIVSDDLSAFQTELQRLQLAATATEDDCAVAAFLAGVSGLTAATSERRGHTVSQPGQTIPAYRLRGTGALMQNDHPIDVTIHGGDLSHDTGQSKQLVRRADRSRKPYPSRRDPTYSLTAGERLPDSFPLPGSPCLGDK